MKRFSRMFTFIFILSIVSALTVPAFATSSLYSTNVYHFRTAKDSSAARYVLNCHTDGIPVSGTKISLWQELVTHLKNGLLIGQPVRLIILLRL